jgi:glutathione S-transferase
LRMLDGRFPTRCLFPSGALGVIAAIVEEVLDEWIARVMVHYRWHYDENALHVLSTGSGRKLQLSDLQDFEIYRWGPRACRATGTELPSQQRAAEDEYIGMLESLENQLASTRYALGDRPSAVDAILLGGLRAHTLADPIPDLSRFKKILAWEKSCDEGWDGNGDWAPFPESTPFVNHMLSIAETEYKPFVLGNARALLNKNEIFDITTYGQRTTYLAREYPERSREMLKRFSYDVLNNSEVAVVDAWLEKTNLTEFFTS